MVFGFRQLLKLFGRWILFGNWLGCRLLSGWHRHCQHAKHRRERTFLGGFRDNLFNFLVNGVWCKEVKRWWTCLIRSGKTSWWLLIMWEFEFNWLVAFLRLLNRRRLISLLDCLADIASEARNLFVSFNVLKASFLYSRNAPVILVFSGCNLLLLWRSDDNRWLRTCLRWHLSRRFSICLRLTLASVT